MQLTLSMAFLKHLRQCIKSLILESLAKTCPSNKVLILLKINYIFMNKMNPGNDQGVCYTNVQLFEIFKCNFITFHGYKPAHTL